MGSQRTQAVWGRTLALIACSAIVLAGCGSAKRSTTPLVVGAVDDAAKWAPNPAAQMQLADQGGLHAIALSAVWARGSTPAGDLPQLRRAVAAAVAAHVQPLLDVYQLSSSTPISAADRTAFTSYAASLLRSLPGVHEVIVGNEPNLNLFWLPQFGPDGADVAARSYEALLAESYDALKAVDPDVTVIGGSLAPRGGDDPTAARQTHSPTRFITDLGRAYRASGRQTPLMDAFSLHVYGESPRIPPNLAHPRTTSIGLADYDKLVALLGTAFDGTGQTGSKLPIVYGEYGVETTVPAAKAGLYTGREVVTPVDPQTQARYYAEAVRIAACSPTVRMLLFFHVVDETRLEGLQSGLRYADGTSKPSVRTVREAERRGCPQG